MSALSVPVVIAARNVRLSAAHLELLFGAGTELVDIGALGATGTFASDRTVDVRGPAGTLKQVRVVGPVVRATEVRVAARDALLLGLDERAPPGLVAGASSPGCTLEGPRGTVVLAGGVRTGLRQLALSAEAAREHGLVDGGRAAIVVRGEREREMRDVPVFVAKSSWAEIDVDDANALDVGPHSVAVIGGRATSSREPSPELFRE